MNTEKHINEFIATQKQISANPNLTEKILDRIANKELKIAPVWQSFAVAASIVLAIMAGVGAGSVYENPNENYVYLEINDTNIENINSYKNIGYE